jgi:hypothetical protein
LERISKEAVLASQGRTQTDEKRVLRAAFGPEGK